MERISWTREELILAMNLYVKIPFGTIHTRNPKIIELAELIGRSVNSVTLRLTNFASHDPYHKARGVKGMSQSSKGAESVFDEFINDWDSLLYESERILAEKQQTTIEDKFADTLRDIDLSEKKGEVRVREVKTRVNQHLFRQMVLANYDNRCAITGIALPSLLVASHIVPWAKNEQERLNPENGLCLSATYDKAFDMGLITIDDNYEMVLSTELKKHRKADFYLSFFGNYEGKQIQLPHRFLPKKEFLDYHFSNIFMK